MIWGSDPPVFMRPKQGLWVQVTHKSNIPHPKSSELLGRAFFMLGETLSLLFLPEGYHTVIPDFRKLIKFRHACRTHNSGMRLEP